MASTLANRAAPMEKTANFFRVSLNFLRNFSASSATSASTSTNPASSVAETATKKRRRKKKKNLIEVASFLPNWGIGYHMAKAHWTGVSYEIVKINLYKDGRHGKAWGLVHKNGLPAADAPKKISGVHKRCWRYIPGLEKKEASTPKPGVVPGLKKEEESTPKPVVEEA
ncbi:uncharacterized protein LOC132307155 [Cornus florida]|uniref:uncharacterized protein LOC132307155 n=1 Tax=Cornus florida TaxID=4283 RepID=UPI00289B6D1F|nr:uncharacterized protein LOC132307155 [Cornus florida]